MKKRDLRPADLIAAVGSPAWRVRLRTAFLAGLLVLLPLLVTYLLLRWLFTALDSILEPLFRVILGGHVPGLGLIAGLLLILALGIVANNVLGRRALAVLDRVMHRIPLARPVYSTTKQIAEAILGRERATFRRVVLVEWPRAGAHTVGFVTGEERAADGTILLGVFIVSAPNPTTGFLMLLPEADAVPTDLSVEEGMKLVLSGGIAGTLAEAARALAAHREAGPV